MREPTHLYLDPLDAIWLTTAHRIGFRVERSSEAYASTDGQGVMVIGTPDTLDPDDCLAQMILHELCHSLVEGAASLALPDFGLDNETNQHDVREHACLRLQASLTAPHGLRAALAPTTDFRDYYDR
ncbi:MAG: YkgJ family cysteine cluster protein, partial [Myxococcota bacterium]